MNSKQALARNGRRHPLLTELGFSVGVRPEEKPACHHAPEQKGQAKRRPNLIRVMFNPWHMGNEASNYLKTVLTTGKVTPQRKGRLNSLI